MLISVSDRLIAWIYIAYPSVGNYSEAYSRRSRCSRPSRPEVETSEARGIKGGQYIKSQLVVCTHKASPFFPVEISYAVWYGGCIWCILMIGSQWISE
jgi:hypothetical protein